MSIKWTISKKCKLAKSANTSEALTKKKSTFYELGSLLEAPSIPPRRTMGEMGKRMVNYVETPAEFKQNGRNGEKN